MVVWVELLGGGFQVAWITFGGFLGAVRRLFFMGLCELWIFYFLQGWWNAFWGFVEVLVFADFFP